MNRGASRLRLAICSTGELYGGVEEFIYTFSEYLKEHTSIYNVVILFNRGRLYDKLSEIGVRVELIPSFFKYNPSLPLKIIKILKRHNINLVHTHGYKANIAAGFGARLCNIKVVKTEHGMQEPTGYLSRLKMSLNLKLDKFATNSFVDKIVYVSKDIRSNYLNRYNNSISQTVIYNGIKPIELPDTKRTHLEKGYLNIGIVGRISKVKGHIYLIDAINELHNNNLRVYAFGDGPLKESLEEYTRNNNLSNKIFFLGFIENIHEYVSELDILVMPSLHEGLPYALLEAMYLRVPVIASRVGGLKEILIDDVDALLVKSTDKKAIAKAIQKLISDTSLRESIIDNAYNKVVKQLMLKKMANDYINVYRKLMGET